ncbi:hypothetical protein M0R45_018784 [Rubus argutus]|uniref:Helitron helicase-like domain-containing protein n=1 Tax=Rubus argutus TaxID=59490 RepID=A0AAW1X563_RUBAR
MQSGSRMSSRKRFFQDLESEGTSAASETFAHEDVNAEIILDQHIYQDEHGDALDQFHTGMRDHQQNSNHKITKRTMFFEHLGDEGTSVNSRITNDNENTIAKDVLENSFSFGQAISQKAKQGLIIQYKDHGDNTFQCVHCNAYYWRDEKNTRGIYTGCCQQGQVRLPQPNPTPQFLEKLLDLNNGRESILFKENIRVYNSMFSFTSMGAKIDYHINDGSGPYVFKICGQVHHLMGSVLPLDGELPKYAQLYVYDTHNEISNRMNAIDPFHNNQKIKQDIVKRLIQMFDEINELTKTFRTVKDKFENDSLPSFNMTMLGRRPIDTVI